MKDLNIIETSNGYYVELEDEILEANTEQELINLIEEHELERK